MRYQLLVFDCDGVMFDTMDANDKYYNYFLEHFGRDPLTQEQLEFVHAHTIDEALNFLFDGDQEIIRQAYEFRKGIDYGDFLKYLTIEPTLVDLLNRIRPPLKTAIATNRTDTMHHLLKEFGLEDHFDMVVTSLDVTRPKPHPEPLQKILDHFGLEPGDALYVGDSSVDAQAATAATMPFAAYRNGDVNAAYYIDSLQELENIVNDTGGEELKDIDWENRVLCSDGNCIGVIGPDGRCKECGQAYDGELPSFEEPAEDVSADEAEETPATPEERETETAESESDADYDPDDWDQRKLCSDGNCIGVIGPDGHCKECGEPYRG